MYKTTIKLNFTSETTKTTTSHGEQSSTIIKLYNIIFKHIHKSLFLIFLVEFLFCHFGLLCLFDRKYNSFPVYATEM